jgi:CubicO group peptidase (beta-lactamase class C family)
MSTVVAVEAPILTSERTAVLAASARALRIPGMSIAVRTADGVQTWTHGEVTKPHGSPVTAQTVFRVGSVSKHVTTMAVMRMAAAGLVDLDADVARYQGPSSRWRAPEGRPGWPPITMRTLLSHTSGLARHASLSYPRGRGPVPTGEDLLLGRPPSRSGPVRREAVPGTGFCYSGGNFTVLQYLLGELTGQPFPALVREWAIEPLGMADTGFETGFGDGRPAAAGHRADGTRYAPADFPATAAGGMWSTPTDLVRAAGVILDALAGASDVPLTRAQAAAMLSPGVPGAQYGLGTVLSGTGGNRWFGHTGDQEGYVAITAAFPESGTAVAVTANSDCHEGLMAVLVRTFLAPSERGRPKAHG